MPKGYYEGRNWTGDQLNALADGLAASRTDAQIGRRVGRSPEAVNLKRKRLGWKPRTRLILSARAVAVQMGIPCSKTVSWWIRSGYLRGRRGQRRAAYRQWYVTIEALYDFVSDERYWHLWSVGAITDRALHAHAREERVSAETFLTTGEVAKRYHVVNGAVHKWIQLGHLHAVRRGNWLIPESALEGFVPPCERSRKGRLHRCFTTAEDARLLQLRSEGRSWPEIGRELGRDTGSVAGRFSRLQAQRVEVAA